LALLLWAAAFAPSSGAWLTDADQAAGEFHAGEWITLTPTVLPSFTPETLVPTADVILPATVTPVPVLLPTATPEPVIVEPTEAPSATALPTEAPSDPEPIPTETPLPEMTGEPAAP
jgi:cell division septation protein DedD